MSKKIFFILIFIGFISVFFTVFQKTPTPPCFNADEAAFSYNAYSILKTGRDEYGSLLPLLLKSFGDYKMPLFTYLSVPIIALFGLNEFGARSLNVILSFVLPFTVYLFVVELFKNKKIGTLSAFLSSVSLGLHIVSRQAHEAYLAATLTTVTAYFFLKLLQKKFITNYIFFSLFLLLLLFSYHPGRLFVIFFLIYTILHTLFQKQKDKHDKWSMVILIACILTLFATTDLIYKPERLKNLAFFNNAGFALTINELKTEGGIRYLYQPIFIGIKSIIQDHLSYYSPQFIFNGDDNSRFGYKGMSIMTIPEYLFFFIGIFYLFKNKERWRWFILSILFISPLSASLSWSKGSLTRSLFVLIPILISSAYGFYSLLSETKKPIKVVIYFVISGFFFLFLIFSWDFYLFHYGKRIVTIHAWQCGYKELNSFIKENYNKYDTFYITKEIGMPYIFSLFYLQYPPEKYQKQANLTEADEYGFGQVERFDKFVFNFRYPNEVKNNSVIIGSVDDFNNTPLENNIDKSKLIPISIYGETIFKIYKKTLNK